jgi:protein involved in polysaccharide export with SLBB domain
MVRLCQAKYPKNNAFFLTLKQPKRENSVLHNLDRRRIPSYARDTLCLLLVVSHLLTPMGAVAQAPSTGAPEPRAPGAPPPPTPPVLLPQPPGPDFPVRSPGGGAIPRTDPCTQATVGGVFPRVPGSDYTLGPGDVLEVQITGRIEVTRQQLVVDPEGVASIPPVGATPVGGLTLREANRRIDQRVKQVLRYADVTLAVAIPRCFEVVLSGEVERPGSIQSSALRRVHDLLLAAGGITPRGSARRVVVHTRTDQKEADLLRFELQGDLAQNPLVEEGMRVHVPPRGGYVTLSGAVRRPGEYEIGSDGSLSELLALTGGVRQNAAATEARLTRMLPDGRQETVSLDLTKALAKPADVPLRAGDVLFVPPLGVIQDVLEIRGAFNGTAESSRTTTAGRPTIVQRFELARGDRVKDVVGRAGGAAAYADLRLAFVDRSGAGGPRQRIPVDLHRLLVEKDDTQNILLENGDVLNLPVAEEKVYVLGEVRTPGAVDFRPDLTPREYLALAGGPTVRARFKNASVTFRNGRSYALAQAPPLEPGAVLTVPEVSVRWYQDYLAIAQGVAGIITAYTSLYFLFRD